MGNKQGLLPNKLNKYSIRKFTVGTASLLVGATLVFGIGSEAQAAELDTITKEDVKSQDKGEALDIKNIKESEKDVTTEDDNNAQVQNSAQTVDKSENSNDTAVESTNDSVKTDETKETSENKSAQDDDNIKEDSNTQEESTNTSSQSSEVPQTKKDTNETSETAIDEDPSTKEQNNKDNDTAQDDDNIKEDSNTQEESTNTSSQSSEVPQTKKDTNETSETAIDEDASTKEQNNKDNNTAQDDDNIKEDSNTQEESTNTSSQSSEDSQTKKEQPDKSSNSIKEPDKQQEEVAKEEKATTEIADKNKELELKNNKTDKNEESELESNLSSSENKKDTVESFLNSQLSDSETKKIMENANIDYDKATDEEINTEILRASLIEMANNKKKTETLATPQRTMFRAMATPTALRAAVNQDEELQKSLGYTDNYTFASMLFDSGKLYSDDALNSNIIPFDLHSYMSGVNSGNRYKIDLKLDPIIAEHVTKISANPSGSNKPVEFVRNKDENGNLTDTWEVNFIRANDGLFGGAEILSQYTAKNGKIELDDTVGNIVSNAGNLSNNKLNYQVFVRDSKENKIVRTSESSGYFLTKADNDLVNLENNVSTENNNAFKASSGSATYNKDVGEFGGILIDQQIMKNGIFSYSKTKANQWSYNYQIDKDLLPYIEGVELHQYDYKGLEGFDKNYDAKNKVADLTIDKVGNGTITSDNLNKLIEFNNALPETVGVRVVLKLNQSVNNILTKDTKYDSEGNLIRETIKQKEDFTFAGYLTDSKGALINNTLATSTLALQDYDKDGLLDRYERQVSLSDAENEDTDGDGKNDGDEVINYKTSPLVGKPQAADITTEDTVVSGSVPLKEGAATQTAKVINAEGTTVGTTTVNSDGTFSVSIPNSPEGTYTIAIDSPNYDNDEVNTFEIVDNSKLPAPSINPVDDNDQQIVVNGTSGSTVTVTDSNNNVLGTVTIPADDTSAAINVDTPLEAGTVLTSTASKDGKTSDVSDQITVTDATAPDAPTLDEVNTDATQVTGQAEPGSTVTVAFPGGGKASTTADDAGNFIVDIPSEVNLEGGETFTATATDETGNESEPSTTTVVDTTAPDAPTVNDVTSNDKVINGTAEPNSTVKLTFPDGTTATGTTNSNGNYTVDIPENMSLKGGETISATSSDAEGNESESATTTVVDATAPDAPTINEVDTNATDVNGTAEPNSTVTVTFPDGTTATGTADDQGNYTIEIPSNVDLRNGNKIEAVSADEAGNVSGPGTTTVAGEDTATAPTINNVTSDDTRITGTADAGNTVTITFPDGTTATGTADDQGNYTIDVPSNVDLNGGEEIQVKATDNRGRDSVTVTTTAIDVTAPDAPVVNGVSSDDTQVTGQAEPGSTVTVTFPDGTTATGTTDDEGNYTIDIPTGVKLEGGEEITATATDNTGNVSDTGATNVTDTTAPDAPVVNGVSSDDTQVTGQAEPGSTVTVTFPDGTTATGKVDEDGNYTIEIPSNLNLVSGENITASTRDESGNESESTETTVVDATAPDAPTVNDVTSDATQVTGQAEPGSEVTVTFPDGTTATGTANDQGNFTIDIPTGVELEGGEEILATATDDNGNTSKTTITTVTDTTAPDAPTVNDVTSDATQVTGQAEPGSTVTVTFPDGTTATGTADDQGNYTIDVPSNVDLNGGEELQVTATDKGGNTSESTNTTVIDSDDNSDNGNNSGAGDNSDSDNNSGNGDNSNAGDNSDSDNNSDSGDNSNAGDNSDSDNNSDSGDNSNAGDNSDSDNNSDSGDNSNAGDNSDSDNNSDSGDNSNAGDNSDSDNNSDSGDNSNAGDNSDSDNNSDSGDNSNAGDNSDSDNNSDSGDNSNAGDNSDSDNNSGNGDNSNAGDNSDSDNNSDSGDNSNAGDNSDSNNNSNNEDNSSSNKDSINQDSNVNSNDSKHDKQNELPETGEKEVRNGTLFGTLFAGLGSLLLFTKRRRKENDKK
ncbi:Ig-like domain-containing protein [Staphylococcus caprae]|uniref:Ig-like domain-containing protein n=2 Tax=Staphylococcus caprae TaxID=29380 RepID=UPI00145279C5|nr:Ig-like domain-containing protein [Staphylococcus caprae]QJE25821.1 YSIRK-type signal peptide-containing protein [Staphylococcus caprae]